MRPAPALLTAAAVTVTAALLALSGSAAARAPVSYSTPGYRGTHNVPKVAQRALPPVTIGVGQDPSIRVDAAGTSHIVWDQPVAGGADRLHSCRLPRRQRMHGLLRLRCPRRRPPWPSHAGHGPDQATPSLPFLATLIGDRT